MGECVWALIAHNGLNKKCLILKIQIMETLKIKLILKKALKNIFYLLLVCVTSVGCNRNKIEYSENDKCFSFETRKAVVLNINTEGFKEGDLLAVGDSGKLVLAKPEDVDSDKIIGMVIKKNKLQIFISKIRAWANAL